MDDPQTADVSLPPEEDWRPLIERALAEDRVREDATTLTLVPPDLRASAELKVKAPGVVCGLPLAAPTFHSLDERVEVELFAEDGDTVGAGTRVLTATGPARALLQAERTVLNLMQRLSGIATRTAAFAERTLGTGARIYDTRKTTPGWRALEKYAVRCGGGANHRLDLADAAMVKENHLVACYGHTGPDAIAKAVGSLLENLPEDTPIYVEVENLVELDAALKASAGAPERMVIMLDDFDLGGIRQAIARLRKEAAPRPQLEITGGVTLERVEALSATGARRISTGALTHSAVALDMSLKIVEP